MSSSSRTSKRKRGASDAEEDHEHNEEELSDPDDSGSAPEDDEGDDGDDDVRPKRNATKGRSKKVPASAGPSTTKKPRTKAPRQPKKPAGTTGGRRKKAVGDVAGAGDFATETKIAADNALFSMPILCDAVSIFLNALKDAIMNPAAALQSTVEDFLESLDQNPNVAQAELINCILRACGCNDSVDADRAVDYDGVLDALDDFTEGLKQVKWIGSTHAY